ncbi:MAG: sulfite exporter TauE/SafE family protein [Methanoregula sp.]|jgi:uncharacterized membrane protein YfcA|uniref:sulfite exporter TauE/SafE family protein n=1 Tax=Methanoregula sp. TaxID=2052170 RepID=UPI003D11F01E
MDPILYTLVILVFTGIMVGFASGLLGVGGGFLMVPVQYYLLAALGIDPTLAIRIAFGTSLAVVIPTALSSAWGHHCRQCVLQQPLRAMILPCTLGGFAGGTIATHLPGRWMEALFGLIICLAAARMMTGTSPLPAQETPARIPALHAILWGLLFGSASGLLGIGGGIIMVPVMVSVMRFSMHQAIGTSTALMIGSSVSGVLSYIVNGLGVSGLPSWSFGYVNLLLWVPLVAVSIPMAQAGVISAHRLPAEKIRLIFVAAMAVVGIAMMISGVRS